MPQLRRFGFAAAAALLAASAARAQTVAADPLDPGVNTSGPRGMEGILHPGATRATYMRQPPSSSCPVVVTVMR